MLPATRRLVTEAPDDSFSRSRALIALFALQLFGILLLAASILFGPSSAAVAAFIGYAIADSLQNATLVVGRNQIMACPGLSHQSASPAMSALQMAGRCLAMFLGTLSLKNVFSTVSLDSYFGKCSDVRCRHLLRRSGYLLLLYCASALF